MTNDGKPPQGCMPYYVAACYRIEELSEAIQRNSHTVCVEYFRIREWAKEIEMQCDIIETLNKSYNK